MPASIGVNMRVTGHYSQGGRKHMEDMFSVAYQQTEDECDLEYAYFGIFDGHGGSEAAAYAKDHLMEAIVSQKQFWSERDADVLRAIRNGFMLTHIRMWKELKNWPKAMHGQPSTAGTTASVAFIRHGKIYIGHVGDSAIVLGYQVPGKDEWNALPLTMDHKPEAEVELRRICSSGGKVSQKLGVPRVVWYRNIESRRGEVRRIEIPFLAIARSLGDHWSYNESTKEFVVSPDPDVGVVAIDPAKFRCLIFGTDGLWNMISPKSAVELVQQVQQQNEKTTTGAQPPDQWQNPSKILVDVAIKRWANIKALADNTSVVTVMMDPPGPPRSRPPLPAPAVGPKPGVENINASKSSQKSQKMTVVESVPETPAPQVSMDDVIISPISKNTSSASVCQESTSKEGTSTPQTSNVIPPLPPVSDISQYPQTSHLSTPANNPLHIAADDEYQTSRIESYFISRLLSKTDLKNSLEHVYDEIMKSSLEPDVVIDDESNNNNTESKPSTEESLEEPVSEDLPSVDKEIEDHTVKAENVIDEEIVTEEEKADVEKLNLSVVEGESIQINEVSSSSPVDSSPKPRKRKSNNIPKVEKAESSRNLRSHDNQQGNTPKPQIREKRSINQKKGVESKVLVPVHTPKSAVAAERVVIQTRPKISISSPISTKNVIVNKQDKKCLDKNAKTLKSGPVAIKQEKPENKKTNSRAEDLKTPNIRMTRSKDLPATPDLPIKVAKEAGSNSTKKIPETVKSVNTQAKDFPRDSIVTRHKTVSEKMCNPSKKLGTPSKEPPPEIIESNSDCCKENIVSTVNANGSSIPLKVTKRKSEKRQEEEPKRKRRTRLYEKEQHQDVTSSEVSECKLGIADTGVPESSSDISVQDIESLQKNKKLKKDSKKSADDNPTEVDSTTINLDKSASRALRSKPFSPQTGYKKMNGVGDKRSLRSNNSSSETGKESRPILRSRNGFGVLAIKGRRKVPLFQLSRHSSRKRCTK